MSTFKNTIIEKGTYFIDNLSIEEDGTIKYCESFFARNDEGDRDDILIIKFNNYSKKITFEDIESLLKELDTSDRYEKLKDFLNKKSIIFETDFWISS